MTYAMTLDNSWELMTEEEMYDVNGGAVFFQGSFSNWTAGFTIGYNALLALLGGMASTIVAAGPVAAGSAVLLVKAAAAAAVQVIPKVGLAIGGAIIGISSWSVAVAIYDALTERTGINFYVSGRFVLPVDVGVYAG